MGKEKLWRIETCSFKRNKDSEYERGLLLNEGDLGVIDMYGKPVKEVYHWRRISDFALFVGLLLDEKIITAGCKHLSGDSA